MLENFRSSNDLRDNYLAGKKLMQGAIDKGTAPEVKSETILNKMFRMARRQHLAPNPIVPNMADYVNWILYDRFVFTAGGTIPTVFNFFTVPIGTAGKTKVDTNLDQVSQLPQPYWMNVTHIGMFQSPNTIQTDILNLWNQSYLEYWVNNKVYVEGPLQCFPGGAGLYGTSVQTGTSTLDNGEPLNGNLYDLRLPAGLNLGNDPSGNAVVTNGLIGINILQSQNFKVAVNLPGGALTLTASNVSPIPGTGLTLQCFLHGVLSRSVQ